MTKEHKEEAPEPAVTGRGPKAINFLHKHNNQANGMGQGVSAASIVPALAGRAAV